VINHIEHRDEPMASPAGHLSQLDPHEACAVFANLAGDKSFLGVTRMVARRIDDAVDPDLAVGSPRPFHAAVVVGA
jgi:hypothetical protein